MKVLPGRSIKWREIYGVKAGQPFVMTVDWSYGNATGIYEVDPKPTT